MLPAGAFNEFVEGVAASGRVRGEVVKALRF